MSNNEQNTSQPQRELEWLARYYHLHGNNDMAREIFEHLSNSRHKTNNVVDLFEHNKERRA